MKNISNRRKYKLFLKDIQRNEKDGYLKIKTFFAEKGVLVNKYDVYMFFNKLKTEQFNRFMKLCTRLGCAAKKRNAFVKAIDIYYCLNPFSKITDPRLIPFYKAEIVTEFIKRTTYKYNPEDPDKFPGKYYDHTLCSTEEKGARTVTSASLVEII